MQQYQPLDFSLEERLHYLSECSMQETDSTTMSTVFPDNLEAMLSYYHTSYSSIESVTQTPYSVYGEQKTSYLDLFINYITEKVKYGVQGSYDTIKKVLSAFDNADSYNITETTVSNISYTDLDVAAFDDVTSGGMYVPSFGHTAAYNPNESSYIRELDPYQLVENE